MCLIFEGWQYFVLDFTFRPVQWPLQWLYTVYPKKYAHGFCFVVVIHWLIFPYPSGLLHWHCGNLTIAPVPAKQPWWIWINTSCEFIMNDCITTTKQSTTKPCAYFLEYTVSSCLLIASTGCSFGMRYVPAMQYIYLSHKWPLGLQANWPLTNWSTLCIEAIFRNTNISVLSLAVLV